MVNICCIGHITSDKVVTPSSVTYMPGGTAWYFSHALANLDISYLLVTSVGATEMHYIGILTKKNIAVNVQPGSHTVYFENIYGNDPDQRTQNVLEKADAFKPDFLADVDAGIFHLGPLLADDMSVEFIRSLSKRGKISLDVQGYLREVIDCKVHPSDWSEKKEALQYVSILKADEAELSALTGCQTVIDGIQLLKNWGLKEMVITNGSKGSVIYDGNVLYTIPAYKPIATIDATGCGDTYMAGYLYRRARGFGIQESGEFAAAMASVKMEHPGPFMGTEENVWRRMGS